ncbi:MAG: hypothetical protein OEV66_00260 [Spirochaetia bacterium]|nr:hypothetical protein [Spirochaetia bacterium]
MKIRKKYIAFFQAGIIFCLYHGSFIYSLNSGQEPNSEFDIFENSGDENKSGKKKLAGLQMDLVVQKQFPGTSIFLPDQNFAVFDSWIFSQILRYSQKARFSGIFSTNIDLGIRSTTNTKAQALKTMKDSSPSGQAIDMIHPMFNEELSFTHFYAYELSLNLNLSINNENIFCLSGGVLPLKMGNSFYRNPVSFFERYLPPREFIQEYTPISFPGIKMGYSRDIYHMDLLFIPLIPYHNMGNNQEGKKISEYLYWINPASIFMAKNSFNFPVIQTDLYFFWENNPDRKTQNHFGFGSEMIWRILKTLNMDWQLMISNGRAQYGLSEKNTSGFAYYSFTPVENSGQQYFMESLVSFNYSAVFFKKMNCDISAGYYFNGFGIPGNTYRSLTYALDQTKKQYATGNTLLNQFHLLFFSGVLAEYDPFVFNQHYLFFNIVSLQDVELFTWGISAFISLEAFSVMPVLFSNFNINSNVKIYLQISAGLGEKYAIFSENPIAGAINGGIQWSF